MPIYFGIDSPFLCKIIEIKSDSNDGFAMGEMIVYRDEEKKDEVGKVVYFSDNIRNSEGYSEEYAIVRKTTPHDQQKIDTNTTMEEEAFKICVQKIIDHKLDMNLMKTVYSFDRSKINFIFTSNDRVDFRELVKDLAKHFQKQIHLQQIGPRDKARLVSGFGKCGQPICCHRFLNKLSSISMEMVRLQNMTNKGSEKLSGCCGKLMCCLAYEVEEYKRLREQYPCLRSVVKTKEFTGEIIGIDVFNNKLKVLTNDGSNGTKIIGLKDIVKVISSPEKSKEEIVNDNKIIEEL